MFREGELYREGDVVAHFSWYCLSGWRYYPPVAELPSGDGITLPIRWGRLVFAGFARIGRVVLSGKGGMVACVLNQEGGMVRHGWLSSGLGG